MANGDTRIETINELKIWLEGEFKLIAQGQANSREDLRQVRTRLHDLSNAVAALSALDIPGKLENIKEELKAHDYIIEKLAGEQTTLRSTMKAAYIAVGIGGAVIGAIATLLLRAVEIFGG